MHSRIQPSEVFSWHQGPIFLPSTGRHATRKSRSDVSEATRGGGGLCSIIGNNNNNNNNNNNKQKKKKKIKQDARKDYLRQHLAVASLAEIENIYLYTGKAGRLGRVVLAPLTPCPPPLPRPSQRTGYQVCNSLGDQVPVEIIGDFLIGAWRRPWRPRDQMVSWAIISWRVLGGDLVHRRWPGEEMGRLGLTIGVHLVHGLLLFATVQGTRIRDSGGLLWTKQMRELTSLGKEVIKGVTEVGNMVLIQRPVLPLSLAQTLHQL